ncbi:MAG: SusE domain-containing protein [Prevotella sp.]|jgi:hypothetical protein|nr:SusE domain-containing protein [Prevotella sp.]
MKTIKYISFIFLAILAFTSCEKDDDTVTYYSENAKSGEMSALQPSYELTLENAAKIMDTFKWSKSDFGYSAAVTYTVQMDLAGEDFANAQDLLSVVSVDSSDVTVDVVNKAMLALQNVYEYPDNSVQKMEFRLQSSITDALEPLYSESITTDIQFYVAFPETMFMIGQDFGNWNWENDGVVEMVPVYGETAAFWCVRYFKANSGFKWAPKKAWANDFSGLTDNVGFIQRDGNAFVESDGMYMVYMDYPKGEITIEPAEIYGIGDCFGGWSSPAAAFTITGDKATITTATAGNLRMYAKSTLGPQDWWKKEFNINSGKIVYRGAGGDQESVPAGAGKKITLDFNAGTGTFE